MAVITSYETLLTAVGDYLARDDLTTFAPNFVQNWEERFYRQPQNWGNWMEGSFTGVMSGGTIAVPTDFLGLRFAYLDASPSIPLERATSQDLYARYPRGGVSGRPAWIARDRSDFVFGPVPDSDYTVAGTYYAKPTLLRDDGTNWLVTNAPDLILYGALVEAEPFLKNDARVALWRDFYADALSDYRDQQRDEQAFGSALVARLV